MNMSRLHLVAVVMTVAGPVLLGVSQQPSDRPWFVDHGLYSLPVARRHVPGCSMGGACEALLARMTNGTLGGERAVLRREHTNCSPRP